MHVQRCMCACICLKKCLYIAATKVWTLPHLPNQWMSELSFHLSVHAHGARSGPNRTPAPPWIFLSGTVRADFFVLPDSSSFLSHFSAVNYKTAKFSFKILCRCAELPAKRMDSARRSARVLASSCSQHSRRAAHSSRRSKRGDYSAI